MPDHDQARASDQSKYELIHPTYIVINQTTLPSSFVKESLSLGVVGGFREDAGCKVEAQS